jgi:hypothetical protein
MFISVQEMVEVIKSLKCGDFEFEIVDSTPPYLQIKCDGICSTTGDPYRWHSRKWFVSYHSTPSELIQTAFLAAMTAVEHELRENFRWNGEPIFRPHFNIRELHKLSRQDKIERRG